MGRRKQPRPHRSGGLIENVGASERTIAKGKASEKFDANDKDVGDKYIEIDRCSETLDDHLDIAEVILMDSRSREECPGYEFMEDGDWDPNFCFRFRLHNAEESADRYRLGHWPVISADRIFLEICDRSVVDDKETKSVVFSGVFDGSDEGVTGLVHLVSQKMLMVRPIKEIKVLEDVSTIRVRVEILRSAFDACQSLLENTRQLWKKSLVGVMAWLRPEVTTEEAIYGINTMETMAVDSNAGTGGDHFVCRKGARFDASRFYEAIKPSKEEPMLVDELPDLLPELRPYQRRASYWMVQREKGSSRDLGNINHGQFLRPLSVPVAFLHTNSRMFYNPFSGNISLHPASSSSYVSGGILADDMGLGKTVELLACIFANRRSASEGSAIVMQDLEGSTSSLKRFKIERVECVCGDVHESPKYKGLWVQCDVCDAWQHADCVGYSPETQVSKLSRGKSSKTDQFVKSRNQNKNASNIVETDDSHICQLCQELIQASCSPVATGATLIVCPSPILHQWNSEITRHTRPGSLRTFVYEGVRNASLSDELNLDISELVAADVVLTTYDVLKEDLSHDSDRHEGDRRIMRFQKRYPVIPTLLTRVYWWRICLDEAQMVESNTGSATEMALRLHAEHRWCVTGTPIQRRLDDLYGLLRFLGASPFDTHRWWLDAMRYPYERRITGAVEFVHTFFKQLMWRSSKAHVADELQLPPQEESVSWLYFSPIEAHFYQRQHETCATHAREVMECFKNDIDKRKVQGSASYDPLGDAILTHAEAAKLLHSLLKLRQACCHPQVGSSGLRSLHKSPMTMDEVLEVLVSKTKIEGEDALRKAVVALNGLAGIAIIEQNLSQAVSLYREALTISEKHSDDFRLDPLLNLHIHHNLAEILPANLDSSHRWQSRGEAYTENNAKKAPKLCGNNGLTHYAKRQKISNVCSSDLTINYEQEERQPYFTSDLSEASVDGDKDMVYNLQPQVSPRDLNDGYLRTMCDNIKQKYLSAVISKLSLAQQEFRNSFTLVSDAFCEHTNQNTSWWLEGLHYVEQKTELSEELLRKLSDALAGTSKSAKSCRITSRFRSISGLKYVIQTGLDSLETSRQALLEELLKIDKTMEKPREEDILRVRSCRNCRENGDGPPCVLCEVDELFTVYETRLFRLTKQGKGGGAMVASAEEAMDLQKKKSALNRFYWDLSHADKGSSSNKGSSSFSVADEDNTKQRDVREKVTVSRSPSELEVVLGVLKNCCRGRLAKDDILAANNQLHLFEAMRKEYTHARSLATAQAQILNAHDEIKMATSRLRLRETDSDTSVDALSSEELVAANVQNTSEKFMAVSLLSRIKGQLRYLKGLKQKTQSNGSDSTIHMHTNDSATPSHEKDEGEGTSKADDENCPVCHESLSTQKMVFQCGHVTCCRCLIAMTEQRVFPQGKSREKWVMCPTCRQPTDFGNIAYADDSQNKACHLSVPNTFQGLEKSEAFVNVQGSYGTKIEAVTRRILWIKSTDSKAKVLVFSNWNDVLDVLEHALSANDISYVRMKGGRKAHSAIAQFKGQESGMEGNGNRSDQQPKKKSFQVLLLLVQHGANGLNLLEAQHVVLIEPLLNPGAEAQAINRVHRIGQDKRTIVHRFIVKDSVEESIFKLNRTKTTDSIISGNTKNQDQVLTLKDVESLFSSSMPVEQEEIPLESLRHLPPPVAAALAAERRLKNTSST